MPLRHGGGHCGNPFSQSKFSEGLRLPDRKWLKLITLGERKTVTQLFALNEDLVLFQLGDREIVVYSAKHKHLAVLARGYDLMVIREKLSSM